MADLKIIKITNLFVATLRAAYLVNQSAHWHSKGLDFYGDHLLFERIYKSAQDDADLSAEKFIGLFGSEAVDFLTQAELISSVMKRYAKLEGDLVAMSLALEKEFIRFSQEAHEAFEAAGVMTLGLTDAIGAIASSREEAIYLLGQIKNQ